MDRHQRAAKRAERERRTGIDADDDAARWLTEHDAAPQPTPPKSASKSKELHRFRQRQQRERREERP